MLTRTALANCGGAFAGVLGRGIAHLTIYLPAVALYLHRAATHLRLFDARPSSPDRGTRDRLPAGDELHGTGHRGLVHTAGERNPPAPATSLPQFFTAGFAWPREAIPDAALALGRMFPPMPRLTASCASTSWGQHLGGRP